MKRFVSLFALVLVLLCAALLPSVFVHNAYGGANYVIAEPKILPQSANAAAGALAPALPATAGVTNYITGFDVTGGGATAASVINCTVTGLAGSGTLNYSLAIPAGVTTDIGTSRLSVRFPEPLPASALNTAITVNVPSFGAGNTQASCTVFGFQR